MMAQWLVYGLAVSLLVSVAAWLGEQGARAQRWPTRWVWLGAMAVSLAVPLAAWLVPAAPEAVPSVVAAPTAYVMQSIPLDLGAASETGLAPATVALAAWAVLSFLLLATIGALAVRLLLRRRGWARRTVEGVDVWVSRNTGPAALGMLRAAVVVPEWALELDGARRRLLLQHEAEHVRARDPQLALAGLLLGVLVPWNLPLWWQLRRLRLAIEVDCDERVLRRAGDVRGYGWLLLEVCHRKSHLAVALAESKSMLERRIRMITKTTKRPATLRALGLSAVAGLVLAVACETPPPTGPADAGSNPLDMEGVREAMAAESCTPAVFVNGARSSVEAVRSMTREIESIEVVKGAAVERLTDGAETCGLISVLTVDATVEEEAATRRLAEELLRARREAAGQEAPRVQTLEEVQDGPQFTPMTVRPQLENAEETARRLEEAYPLLLRDAGIGGTVSVWFLIDEEGTVQRLQINRGSGHPALDEAALRVAGGMAFTPAYNRDQRVPVWIAFDISFETQPPRTREAEIPPMPEEVMAGETDPTEEAASEPAGEPVFTPMTEQPRLINNRETAQRLETHYPPLLRNAGIGGTANVWFHIGEDGTVQSVRINESSGYDALDAAALKVAREMIFTPAKNRDEVVDAWVALDVTFEAQR